MAQIAMTETERVESIERLGYTEPEARFVCLAALHGGYFLRRQYADFAGKPNTAATGGLIEKLLDFEHATVSTFLYNTHVYHLAARRLYSTIGQEDNRNRREKEPLTIKNKLMCLDFVLAHAGCRFLATESEKVRYVNGDLRIEITELPGRRYPSAKGGPSTMRYFVDKYPIFLPADSGNDLHPLMLSFCFVDEGQTTSSRFESFLHQYAPLLSRLHAPRVIYVSAGHRTPPWAHPTFTRFAGKVKREQMGRNDTAHALAEHFRQRYHFESRNWAQFDRMKLAQYRQDRSRFSGPDLDRQFDLWKRMGTLPENFQHEVVQAGFEGTFSAHLLPNRYGFFGGVNR